MSLEARIHRLEAYRAVEALIADLGRAFDAGPSAARLLPLFTADASFRIDRYGTLHGARAIADGVAGNADKGFRWTLHYLVSPRIELSDAADRASIDFMLWETATSASGRAYWIGGRYLATAIDEAGSWRFAALELQADLISHYPAGWQEKPAALDEA